MARCPHRNMIFRRSLFFLFVFYVFNSLLFAETLRFGTVAGRILDEQTRKPLEFAGITLFKTPSNDLVGSKTTSEDGTFLLEGLPAGSYRIEVNVVAYFTEKRAFDLQDGENKKLGEVALKTSGQLLKAVEVTGIQSNMKIDVDKKVFSVDQSVASAGANATDVLKNIPSVEVDADGAISLRNNTNVTVWINGKPSGLNSDNRDQVLEQMPAESIDRIEVVTNPSAKYSAEGSAGIINIVLKKNRKAGYYGSVNAGLNNPWGKTLGVNFNGSNSKVDVYANMGFRDITNFGNGYTNRQSYFLDEQNNPEDTTYMHAGVCRTFSMEGLFLRGGLD